MYYYYYYHYDIRLIQEEKETAELRAEELENRVAVDTLPANWRPEVVYDRSSPPLSGRSTPSPRPSLQSHDYLHKYHTLNSAVSQFPLISITRLYDSFGCWLKIFWFSKHHNIYCIRGVLYSTIYSLFRTSAADRHKIEVHNKMIRRTKLT